MWAGFVAYLGALAVAPRLGRRGVWGLILVLVTGFALAPVILSHDVYSYVDYARLGVRHGLNPYVYEPDSAPGDAAFVHVTWIDAKSAYGPLFTLATYPLAWLPVGVAVAVLKAAAAFSVLGIAVLVSKIAAWRGVDPLRATAFVALNPLVLAHVVGGAHNDGLMMLLVMLGVAAVLSARELSGGVALLAAVATKLSAAFIAPFALLGSQRPKRMLAGAVATALAITVAAYLAFGWEWLHGVGLAGENQSRTSHLSIPTTFARISGLGPDGARLAAGLLFAALVAYLLVWTRRGGDWVRASAWTAFALLLATSWLLPWYLLWPLPLVAISRDRPLQLLTLGLTAYQLGARIPL
ncbi:MAG: glycosyltransferase family 87 protein [Solirubrobacterales bacterium]